MWTSNYIFLSLTLHSYSFREFNPFFHKAERMGEKAFYYSHHQTTSDPDNEPGLC